MKPKSFNFITDDLKNHIRKRIVTQKQILIGRYGTDSIDQLNKLYKKTSAADRRATVKALEQAGNYAAILMQSAFAQFPDTQISITNTRINDESFSMIVVRDQDGEIEKLIKTFRRLIAQIEKEHELQFPSIIKKMKQ